MATHLGVRAPLLEVQTSLPSGLFFIVRTHLGQNKETQYAKAPSRLHCVPCASSMGNKKQQTTVVTVVARKIFLRRPAPARKGV